MKKKMRLKRNLLIKLTKKDTILIVAFLVLLIVSLIFKYINTKIVPPLEVYAENEVKKISSLIISDAVESISFSEEETMSFFNTLTNKSDEVISVDFNTAKINKSLVKLNKAVYKDLKLFENGRYKLEDTEIETENLIYKIPLGYITGNYTLSNIGPKVPLKAKVIGSVVSNIKTEVSSYGINNSLLKVYIDVTVNMRFMLPLISKDVLVNNSIPLVVKIIQGKIPNVYGGSYAVTSPITSSN
jgi:sporulation protein YunB